MFTKFIPLGTALLVSAALFVPGRGSAQTAPNRSLTVVVGGFTYDVNGDAMAPMVAMRVDQRLTRRLVAEVSVSYARADVDIVDYTEPDPVSRVGVGNIGAATVGMRGELPLDFATPYLGIATGLFVRAEHGQKGANRFVRTTTEFPVGVLVPITQRVSARAESRLRFDEHTTGGTSVDNELTLGLSWSF